MTDHPVNDLDDLVHQRVRLGILAITHQAKRVEFTYLRDTLDVTAGNLSQHLTTLERAGLITIDKGYQGRRPRTWISLTRLGTTALDTELRSLKALIHQIDHP
jgi:DNA-binding MarR family transcriptional regulator